MKFFTIYLFVVYICGICNGYLKIKPDWIQTCQVNSPDYDKCSSSLIQEVFNRINDGNNELETIGKIDPLKIKKLKLAEGKGSVGLNATLLKVIVTGMKKVKILNNLLNQNDLSGVTKFFLPKLRIDSNYRMLGHILVLPINGRGKCWMEPTDIHITINTKSKLYKMENHTFLNVTNIKVHYSFGGISLNFSNLFQGVRALEDSTNAYFNENWRDLEQTIRPVMEKAIEDILLTLLQKIFSTIPVDYLASDLS